MRLERVAERVAEIEQHPLAEVEFVVFNDRLFDRTAGGDDLVHMLHKRCAPRARLEQREKRLVADGRGLDDLRQPVAEGTLRQRVQERRVDEDRLRLIERTDEVFPPWKIYGDLAADRAVDLSQERRRHLHERHAAQVRRRREASEIPHNAAAEGQDKLTPLQAEVEHRFKHMRKLRKRLRLFPGRNGEQPRLKARRSERRTGARAVQGLDVRVGYDKNAPSRINGLKPRSERIEQPGLHCDVIAFLAERDMKHAFQSPSPLLYDLAADRRGNGPEFLHQLAEHARLDGLAAVAQGVGRIVVHFDDKTVRADGDGRARERLDHPPLAGGMARVDDHRQMAEPFDSGDGAQIERISRIRFKCADAALT